MGHEQELQGRDGRSIPYLFNCYYKVVIGRPFAAFVYNIMFCTIRSPYGGVRQADNCA